MVLITKPPFRFANGMGCSGVPRNTFCLGLEVGFGLGQVLCHATEANTLRAGS